MDYSSSNTAALIFLKFSLHIYLVHMTIDHKIYSVFRAYKSNPIQKKYSFWQNCFYIFFDLASVIIHNLLIIQCSKFLSSHPNNSFFIETLLLSTTNLYGTFMFYVSGFTSQSLSKSLKYIN